MKRTLWLFLILIIPLFAFGQIKLVKKDKMINLQNKEILSIQTNSEVIFASYDFEGYLRKKKYSLLKKFQLDKIEKISLYHKDSIKVTAKFIDHYLDTLSGNRYTPKEMIKVRKSGNYQSIKSIEKDTIFYYALSEIKQFQIKKDEEVNGGGFGAVGLLLGGTIAVITGVVVTIKDGIGGLIVLAIGGGCFGLAKYIINKSKYWNDYKIGLKEWEIVIN